MLMGAINAAPIFLAMIMKLKMEWCTLSEERGLKIFASKIIVVALLPYERTSKKILVDLKTVLVVLKHHYATLNLNFFKWFQYSCKFVCMYVVAGDHNLHIQKWGIYQDRAT